MILINDPALGDKGENEDEGVRESEAECEG